MFTIINKLECLLWQSPPLIPWNSGAIIMMPSQWMCGALKSSFFVMVTSFLPFEGSEFKDLWEWVLCGIYDFSFFVSIDIENLLKKFLIHNRSDRGILEEIMRDPVIDMGPEEELKPYIEPSLTTRISSSLS